MFVAGYRIGETDTSIGEYETIPLAEAAIASDATASVDTYWLASFIYEDTGKPEILAYIEPA
jgi:hypothetical protein